MLNSDDIGSSTGEFEGLLRENNINNENNNNINNNSNNSNNSNNNSNGGIISNTLSSIGTLINNQIGNRINTITGNNNNNSNNNNDNNNIENNTNLLSHSYGSNTSSDSEKEKYSINEIGISGNNDKKRALYKLDEEDDTNSFNEDEQRIIQPSSSPIPSSTSSSPQLQPQSSPQLSSSTSTSSSPQPQSSPIFKSSSSGILINEKKKNKSFIQLEDGSSNVDSDDQDSNNGSIPLHILHGSTIIDDESNLPLSGEHSHDNNCKSHNHYSAHEEKTHNNYILSSYDKIPPYLQGNEFIATGYRVNFSYKLCFKSIFRFHNETLNIWTHLLGAVLFFILMVYTLSSRLREDATSVDKFVFAMFFICAQAQMLFSAIFHTFCSVSGKAYLFFARLDYTGISLMIVGSHYPPIYYLFHKCHPNSGIGYLVLISLMGVVGIIVGMIPIFQTYSFRTFRTVFFVVFGLFIVIPLPQIWAQSGISFIWPILSRLMIMGSMYIGGAIIYATRYPEVCCRPGALDRGLSSHVIWHCFVVAAAVVQFYNCLYAYDHYSGPNSFACPDASSSTSTFDNVNNNTIVV